MHQFLDAIAENIILKACETNTGLLKEDEYIALQRYHMHLQANVPKNMQRILKYNQLLTSTLQQPLTTPAHAVFEALKQDLRKLCARLELEPGEPSNHTVSCKI